MQIELSPKQCEFINNANHRFNGKIGATQCGKTFIDIAFVIVGRIMERRGKKGLNLILGVTKETIERNVLEPMRDHWGEGFISEINNRNICHIFGEKVYCLGSEKVSQVSKLRGAKFKYVYIDEIVDANQEVFELLKSRLSLEYSVCDFTGNPSHPAHYIKKFIDSDADVYCQGWTLYDNPFLPEVYIKSLEVEYAGTVYFDRYVLGKWKKAEGLVYPMFDVKKHVIPTVNRPYRRYQISVDYGTFNPFSAGLWGLTDYEFEKGKTRPTWIRMREYRYCGRDKGVQLTPVQYLDEVNKLADGLPIECIIVDPSADAFRVTVASRSNYPVVPADNPVLAGIEDTSSAIQNQKFLINDCCQGAIEEFGLYSWDEKATEDVPVKDNDHSMDEIRYFVRHNQLALEVRDWFGRTKLA